MLRKFDVFAARLAVLVVFHAASAGLASTVLVSRLLSRVPLEWMPIDNQTLYILGEGEKRNLQLNSTGKSSTQVFVTVSPCTNNFRWSVYHGTRNLSGPAKLVMEYNSGTTQTFSASVSPLDKYIIQMSPILGGSAAVSVRGEDEKRVRMRLRVKSRRKLIASWDPSPIDPQSTTYCVVASKKNNYTSLCAATYDLRTNRHPVDSGSEDEEANLYNLPLGVNNTGKSIELDNSLEINPNVMQSDETRKFKRRNKFSRSTKVEGDPVIACVGERTHHIFENLDPNAQYHVSVFGVAKDRSFGSLLATSSVRPRTSTGNRLKENVPLKTAIRDKAVYYFKTTVTSGGGLWLAISICGGAVDVEVLVRGKRLHFSKNIDCHSKFFVPGPIPSSSIQETSDESFVTFDSSSEETRMRYVIRVVPTRLDLDGTVNIEITASTSRWGMNVPELLEQENIVRELRPKRTCRSVDVAFLPAKHKASDIIRYCISVRENIKGDSYTCFLSKRTNLKTLCFYKNQRTQENVIVHRLTGLKPGKNYAVQVTASAIQNNPVPYKMLYVDTNAKCKD